MWVSEFRIESSLNCGGHAFVTKGHLLGPILEEFKHKKDELVETLHEIYSDTMRKLGRHVSDVPREATVTVQGGIGTAAENEFLLKYYRVDGTGWGTPFLLVPDVTNVDAEHLERLAAASGDDVYVSGNSPFGVPFWYLRTSASEVERRRLIASGHPGSLCPKGLLAFNTEFTERPLCTASRAYQKLKLDELSKQDLSDDELAAAREAVLAKSCICRDLAGSVYIRDGIDPDAKPTICSGPGIVDFCRTATLREMVGHIYGRLSLLTDMNRPNMFIRELRLYVEHLRDEIEKRSLKQSNHTPEYFREFKENLLRGIDYYRELSQRFIEEKRRRFLEDLARLREAIEPLMSAPVTV